MSANVLFTLIATPDIGRNIDPDEVLRYFSWARYAIIAIVYTVVVFWLELAKDGPFIFSPKNTRSKLQVYEAHTVFLSILLFGYRTCITIVPTLPFWMTDTIRVRYSNRLSLADLLSCLAAFGMAYFERKWLYRERSVTAGVLENTPSD